MNGLVLGEVAGSEKRPSSYSFTTPTSFICRRALCAEDDRAALIARIGPSDIRCAEPPPSCPHSLPMIRDAIITMPSAAGDGHITPLGLIRYGEGWIIAPFHPSRTLDNFRTVPFAVANYTDDARVFAGFLRGQSHCPTLGSKAVQCRLWREPAPMPNVRAPRLEDPQRGRAFTRRIVLRANALRLQGFQKRARRRRRSGDPRKPFANAAARAGGENKIAYLAIKQACQPGGPGSLKPAHG